MFLTSGVETSGDVCIIGSHRALGEWGSGVVMLLSCPSQAPKIYRADALFPAGSNPYVEYKFQKDGCATWESTGNHSFTIDEAAPFYDIRWVDGWDFVTPGCPGRATATE